MPVGLLNRSSSIEHTEGLITLCIVSLAFFKVKRVLKRLRFFEVKHEKIAKREKNMKKCFYITLYVW